MSTEVVTLKPPMRPGQRPIIVGVLNVTPDSFSDGGEYVDLDAAIAQAVQLRADGADIIDVGGESTRPGAERIDPQLEQDRVLPVIAALSELDIPVSIDTMNASTAQLAIDAGARMINDVSGGLADPEMFRTVAASGVHYVASHWRGPSENMDDLAEYGDVVTEVRDALKERIAELIVWGTAPENIIIDPGLGFAKTAEHNWALLSGLPELESIGYPLLIGASRKRFLEPFETADAASHDRDFATAITSALAAQSGVWGVRVHNVSTTKKALDVWSAWRSGGKNG
ncbi:MAG TPA: dihydropteroate synthase [Galbitalea sp.]|jgi:dihydropteroate synthase